MHTYRSPGLLTAILASVTTSHVILETPKPYKFMAYGPSNPIAPDGSDFPCKIPPGKTYQVDGSPTKMAIGEDQTLSFQSFAVHGGGSCQVALFHGLPTKDSEWKVIHSIEGGCPARNQKGNLDGPNKDKYAFQIPSGIEPGANWTLAWTWQPRIGGEPEFYMNCAPITILPSKKRAPGDLNTPARQVEFPNLFVANMGAVSGECTTEVALEEQVPIAYPNPGSSVERPEGDDLFPQPCDGNSRAKDGSGASDSDQGSTSTVSETTAITSTTLVVSASTGKPPAFEASSASSASTTPATGTGSDNIPTQSSGGCLEGYLTCLDGARFATCTGGQLTGPQLIASGYKCTPGEGIGLDIIPA
ncbi:hypothetical protein F5Y15DRAFT_129688 [Xylariaceae sp. FL0016]|nr:hypothetical protein F5Y15DRAFT_129688 [Xylariaceae sp. FL0016]